MQIHYSIYIDQFTCFQLNFYLSFINFYGMEQNYPIKFVYIHHLKYWLAHNSNTELHHSFSYYCFEKKKKFNTLCFIIIISLTIQILICNIWYIYYSFLHWYSIKTISKYWLSWFLRICHHAGELLVRTYDYI